MVIKCIIYASTVNNNIMECSATVDTAPHTPNIPHPCVISAAEQSLHTL